MTFPRIAAIALAAAGLSGAPALAQSTPATPPAQPAPQTASSGNTNEIGTATIKPSGIPPSQRNPLLTDQGNVQISKLIGTDVYNKNDKKLGSVKEVLADANGKLQAVVSTSDKQVVVPWDKLQFGDAKLNSDNKVLMQDETEQSLNSMPTFNPKSQNQTQKKG